MKIEVLLSSGDVDEWDEIEEVNMDMDLGGALCIIALEDAQRTPLCVYAPGMWMKWELVQTP